MQAYREAAVKALRQWCQTEAPLEPMEEADTESTFVERCVASCTSGNASLPRWHLDAKTRMVVSIEMRKRARATFAKYQPKDAASSDENLEGDTQDEGEVEEDGEVETEETPSQSTGATKKKPSGLAKKTGKKKVIVRKKGTTAKQATGNVQRKSGPSNRGRRGGRGGKSG